MLLNLKPLRMNTIVILFLLQSVFLKLKFLSYCYFLFTIHQMMSNLVKKASVIFLISHIDNSHKKSHFDNNTHAIISNCK